MNRCNTPWRPLPTAQVCWSDNNTPRSEDFEDWYYSSDDGLEESSYVFLQGNKLPGRWMAHPRPSFRIVETGFGTGLNFLLTWQLWRQQAQPRPRLHYLSIEKQPLHKSDLKRSLANWPELGELVGALLDNYPQAIAGQHRLVLEGGDVILDLWWEDAWEALTELASFQRAKIDCWYLDGFAPRQNPSMWTDQIFDSMASLSAKDASFATFTAVGHVRRGLEKTGFEVRKRPGYGKKRECMCGEISAPTVPRANVKKSSATPWDIGSTPISPPSSAIIIGAGIAGCTVASSLARRNISVHVLECNRVAGAGSGNTQGVLYTRLSKKYSPLTDFSLQSFLFAERFYRQLISSGELRENIDGALCGSFHQSDKPEELAAIKLLVASVPDVAQVVSAPDANRILGIDQSSDGYWFPGSGWMHPGAVCGALLRPSRIKLTEHTGSVSLKQISGGWAAIASGTVLAEAECVVVAAGTSSTSITPLDWLPLQAIRGQTSILDSSTEFSQLRAALCHKGYIPPARNGQHCIGATFDINDYDVQARPGDHRNNLDMLSAAVPGWHALLSGLNENETQGRVGYRCASPDYLPLIGPVPDRTMFLQNYAALRKNARRTIDSRGNFIPGLYLSTGHGSRGLTSTPLAAEILASAICDEPLPVSRELHRAISPGRFLIRDLQRKKI